MGAGASVTGPNSISIVEDDYRGKLKAAFNSELTKLGVDKKGPALDLKAALAGKEKDIHDSVAAVIAPTIVTDSSSMSSVEKIRQRVSYTYVVAVDGSEASDVAFDASKAMLRRQDHLCCFHAFSDLKNSELPSHLKSEALKEKYENDLIGRYSLNRFSFLWEDRGERDVKTVLMELTNMYRVCDNVTPDFIIMGYTGRKGIRKTEGPTTLGSNSDFALRHIHLPCILIKNPVPVGAKTFVMAVNKSDLCKAGLDLLFGLLAPRDTLTVITIDDGLLDKFGENNLDVVKQYYEGQLSENASDTSSFKLIPKDGTVAQTIINAINEIGPDFCAIAPRAKEVSGSFTEQIILGVKSSIILCKS